eukprot:CAMPEP_0197651970 /NCGR_PEP_ID=MMETSP1338-20131121/34167_1 /TAXON_ID=43686 ORGANISM="Pelagodinium beii, Strain RCC1491" /NCGR_SAMPLE_ID=MMETSP1338 /ASSEMBLY_ACC=CAM_ASM_000754 /LENGTH=557 /DNA_ID=CAMNT_0043226747 /DNA_START=11 /DNA_END=1684 /DNA_ORIENTATION=-
MADSVLPGLGDERRAGDDDSKDIESELGELGSATRCAEDGDGQCMSILHVVQRYWVAGAWIALWVYLAAALFHDWQGALPPTIVAALVGLTKVWSAFCKHSGRDLDTLLVDPLSLCMNQRPRSTKAAAWIVLAGLLTSWVVLIVAEDWYRLVPAAGLLMLVGLTWFLSAHRRQVWWRPVFWGIGLQLLFALLIMRTRTGFLAFQHLGKLVAAFLDFADEGSKFVFGDQYASFFIAFKVLPVVIFFSGMVSVAYHAGILQAIFMRVGWLMQRTLGTAYSESLVAAANIFIGMTEAPLLVKPFLVYQTKSEIHALMTSGFATVAGGVMAAYVSFGIPAEHLLAASLMSCPAALAMAKLSYPETEETSRVEVGMEDMLLDKYRNAFDAMSSGVTTGVLMVANIAGNLIAFVAAMAFMNSALTWAGSLVGIEGLTFQLLCSYLLWPIAFMMGVPAEDCKAVGLLLGEKTIVNEMLAYEHLSQMKAQGTISERAEIIATYALCGFANFGSIGIQIGGLGAIAPSRKSDIAELALRAMLTGTVACFMTACIAGMLVENDSRRV